MEKEYVVGRIELGPESWAKLDSGGQFQVFDMAEYRRQAFAAGVAAMREAAARLCVRRSVSWSEADDARSQDYREGIEVAASQIAAAIRDLPDPPA